MYQGPPPSFALLLPVLLACVALAVVLRWWAPRLWAPSATRVDVLLTGLLVVAGCGYAFWLHQAINPSWLPFGEDWWDFVNRVGELRALGGDEHAACSSPNRYLLFPTLGLLASSVAGTVVTGCIAVSVTVAGLIPAALYLLGRQLAPAPWALAGAITALHCPALLDNLGPPSDYLLMALLLILCLAAGLAAVRRGGAARFGAWGVCLALLLGCSPQSLITLLWMVPAAGVALALHHRGPLRDGWRPVLALTAPLVAMWLAYAVVPVEVAPLEGIVQRVQQEMGAVVERDRAFAAEGGTVTPAGDDEPAAEPGLAEGSWRPGRLGALWGLPRTVKTLASLSGSPVPMETRASILARGIRAQLPFPAWSLGLALFALVGVATGQRGEQRARRWFAAMVCVGLLLAFVGSQLTGLAGTIWLAETNAAKTFPSRYAAPLLLVLPCLILAGAGWAVTRLAPAEARGRGLAGLPLLTYLVLFMALASGGWSVADTLDRARQRAESRAENVGPGWRAVLTPLGAGRDVELVNFANVCEIRALFHRSQQLGAAAAPMVELAPSSGERLVVQPCVFSQVARPPLWMPASPERLEELGPCVHLDREPDRPLELLRRDELAPTVP